MRGGHFQAFLFMLHRPEPIRQTNLLMILAGGLGDSTALSCGLKSLAIESHPPFSNRVTQLRVLLEQGQKLSEALATTTGLLPDDTVIAIRVAESTGTLRQVLADEAHRLSSHSETYNPVQISLPAMLLWVVAIGLIGFLLMTFVTVAIVPKFLMIFEDFGIELPDITARMLWTAEYFGAYWYLYLLPGITLFAWPTWWLIRMYLEYISLGRVRLTEHIPRYWSPLITRLLSLSVATRNSLDEGVHEILVEMRPGRASERLSRVRQCLMSGDDCWTALKDNGFLRHSEVLFLRAAERSGHLDWALQHLSRAIERRRLKLADRLVTILQPAAIIGMGAIVALVITAFFMPLIELINQLAVILPLGSTHVC